MPSQLVTFRFPAATEFRVTENPPKVGEVLTRGGDEWVVLDVEQDGDGHVSVTLRPSKQAKRPFEIDQQLSY